jgi:hypothetical protein
MEDKSYASKDVVYRMLLNQQWVFIVVLFVCFFLFAFGPTNILRTYNRSSNKLDLRKIENSKLNENFIFFNIKTSDS